MMTFKRGVAFRKKAVDDRRNTYGTGEQFLVPLKERDFAEIEERCIIHQRTQGAI